MAPHLGHNGSHMAQRRLGIVTEKQTFDIDNSIIMDISVFRPFANLHAGPADGRSDSHFARIGRKK